MLGERIDKASQTTDWSLRPLSDRQISYAIQAIQKLMTDDIKYLDVKQEVQDGYNAGLQKRMKHMAWSSGCNSWYLNPDGSNHSLFPGYASEYCLRARKFKPSEYVSVPS